MVIQRIQSLFLLLAAMCILIFCFVPFADITVEVAEGVTNSAAFYPTDTIACIILNVLIAVLLVIDIFMFKNLRRQRSVALICAVLIAGSIAVGVLYTFVFDGSIRWFGGIVLLVVALVLDLMAYKRMGHDQKLLRSYDRLR